MADIKELPAFLKRIEAQVKKEANRLKREVVVGILTEVVFLTPVDTSLHLSNWKIGVGAPRGTVFDAAVPGKDGSTQGVSAAITLATGAGHLTGNLLGTSIFVSNHGPVIEELDAGIISDKGGFVQAGLDDAQRIVNSFQFTTF